MPDNDTNSDKVERRVPRALGPEFDPDQSKEANDQLATRKAAFEADQKAAAAAFERDQEATANRVARERDLATARAEEAERVAQLQQENDDRAFADGFLSHEDLTSRRELLAAHRDYLLPHQAFAPGEEAVKMAFPRTTLLTRSAADVRRVTMGLNADEPVDPAIVGQGAITHGSRVLFYKGYHDVPVGLADHHYLYDNGAYRVGDDGKPEPEADRLERLRASRENA